MWVGSVPKEQQTIYTIVIRKNDLYLDGNKIDFVWALAPNSKSWNLFRVEPHQQDQ